MIHRTGRSSRRAVPTSREQADLEFAWQACRYVRSNAIVIAKDRSIAGMGAGQPNRVNSVEIAARAAGGQAAGAALASDAYFPFPDGVERAAEAGVTAIVQPGGSIRDDDVTAAADQLRARHGAHRSPPLPALIRRPQEL